jgi:hypothetical protein
MQGKGKCVEVPSTGTPDDVFTLVVIAISKLMPTLATKPCQEPTGNNTTVKENIGQRVGAFASAQDVAATDAIPAGNPSKLPPGTKVIFVLGVHSQLQAMATWSAQCTHTPIAFGHAAALVGACPTFNTMLGVQVGQEVARAPSARRFSRSMKTLACTTSALV